MAVVWDTIIPMLAPHIPAAPHADLRAALAASAADFLAKTYLWREVVDQEMTEAGEPEYVLSGSDGVVEGVLWATIDNNRLDQTDPRLINPGLFASTGRPNSFWLVDDTKIRLFPTPDGSYQLSAMVVIKLARDASGIPEWVYQTFVDDVISGAVWRLAQQPGKPWSDPSLAVYHKQRFDKGVANAKIRDVRGVNLFVQPRSFA